MKFVLKGRTFDTSTAISVAIDRGVRVPTHDTDEYFGAESVRFEYVLYRTPKGAFFVHYHDTVKFPRGKPVIEDVAEEVTPEKAVQWIVNHGAMILDTTDLPLPPEA